MPPKKRRTKPGDTEHHGRVTTPRNAHDPRVTPSATEPSLVERAKRYDSGPATPPPSSRYTPPIRAIRFRPGWHKLVGALLLVLGAAVAVLNDVMLLGASTTLLPGGHSEFYLILGVAIAGSGTWWFGWFDRER
ncbi:MAG: hypothetical protein HZB15_14135 [Actinobacteria bacterium]|nr:hypothetical protein [Actinomycetota bacterium]